MLRVSDMQGNALRWIKASAKAGTHRVSWDLRLPAPDAIELEKPDFVPPWAGPSRGAMVLPGQYQAELMLLDGGKLSSLAAAKTFKVKATPTSRLGLDYAATTAFQKQAVDLMRRLNIAYDKLDKAQNKLKTMQAALIEAPRANPSLFASLEAMKRRLNVLDESLSGDADRKALDEETAPSLYDHAYYVSSSADTRVLPTRTMRDNLAVAEAGLATLLADLKDVGKQVALLDQQLIDAGAPSSQ